MTKFVGNELPYDLYERLQGDNLEAYADKVILISTVDGKGWPHPAMLSYFEVVALDRRNLRLATYKASGTTDNMRSNGLATISIIDERMAYYIKGSVTELKREMASTPHNAKLNMHIEQVLKDEANEEYEAGAYVSGGVTYRNPNRAAEMLKAREVLAELLEEEVVGNS
ncbi:MAG TPA: pyridoxamine 5'-phosphate oxidase family protein [Pyrinomonadaceae bacterium]|nr:pyridoxamine 5'-phosphate oxidase family protein [Pyrinomonadaceae bacterium]